MKKTVLSLLLLSVALLCAVQPGLPSSDVKFIKQFRLPAWNSVSYEFSFSGGAHNRADSYKDYEESESEFERYERYGLRIHPKLLRRNESEISITELKGGLYSYFSYRDRSNPESNPKKDINRYISFMPELSINHKAYISANNYLNLGAELVYDYRHRYKNKKNEQNDRETKINLMMGYGYGKVRDVAPVIKALRFSKRYSSLGKGQFLDSEIGEIAKVISKRNIYNITYDRSNKYFWDDMYKAVNGKMEGLSGYETFMVMDGLSEYHGNRLEGSDLSINVQYKWVNVNDNNSVYYEDDIFDPYEVDTNLEETTAVFGPILQGRYYSNLSIDYQVGFEAEAAYYIPTSKEEQYETNLHVKLNHSELYSISDRILYLCNVDLIHANIQYSKKNTLEIYQASLRNDFTFYIENNVSINLGASVAWEETEKQDTAASIDEVSEVLNWDLNISLNYRFRTM